MTTNTTLLQPRGGLKYLCTHTYLCAILRESRYRIRIHLCANCIRTGTCSYAVPQLVLGNGAVIFLKQLPVQF